MSRIHNLDSLDRELHHLKKQARDIEKKLELNSHELKENFGGMAWNSLLGTMRNQDIVSGVADRILHSSKIQDNVYGIIDKVSNFVATVKSKITKK
jgi:hypothetical protein